MPTQLDDFEGLMLAGQQMSLEDLRPATLTINGLATEYAAHATPQQHTAELGAAGVTDQEAIVFRVRKAVLATAPEKGAEITHVEKALTFSLVRVTDCGTFWRLECNGEFE